MNHIAVARLPRVVIVGAGFCGLAAATALANSPFDVTLVDQYNYHLFQPLLYQVATAGLSNALPGKIHRTAGGAHVIRSIAARRR